MITKKILFVLMVALVLAACTPAPDPVEVVTEKSQARWDALIARDFIAARQYYTPGFRERIDEFEFRVDMERRPVRWESVEIQSVTCEESRCDVVVNIGYRVPVLPGGVTNLGNRRDVSETWIQLEDDWWYADE